jgi:hypothetical protein
MLLQEESSFFCLSFFLVFFLWSPSDDLLKSWRNHVQSSIFLFVSEG